MIIRRSALVLGAIAAASTLAACGSGSSGGTPVANPQPTQTVTITETPTSTPPTGTTTTTPAPATSTSPVTPISATACTTGQLSLSLGAGQGTAGSTYQPIIFTNTSSASCSLRGYPGVSFVDSSGAQLGKAAGRTGAAISSITLAAHGTASALLRLPDPGVFSPGDCNQTTASRLKVYPPNQTGALLVADPAEICTTKAGKTSIGPVHSGTNG